MASTRRARRRRARFAGRPRRRGCKLQSTQRNTTGRNTVVEVNVYGTRRLTSSTLTRRQDHYTHSALTHSLYIVAGRLRWPISS
eukprot:scaffold120172_cov54-Phaeocystis_antarctica.AAC.1